MKKHGTHLFESATGRLIHLRKLLGLTRQQMAKRLGVSDNAYGKNETGDTLPGYHSLYKLRHDFGISMDWFLFGDGDMYYKDPQEILPALPTEAPPESALAADVRDMLEKMEHTPELHYSMMLYFHRFKKENSGLFEEKQKKLAAIS
jgi:transcriptional regulator with XRE-family HTH domain